MTFHSLPWTDPDWIEAAHAWIRAETTRSGRVMSGAIEQIHVRLWSTVMRVPTDEGILYFKACQPPVEVAMTLFLREIERGAVPRVVAADPERGWMLMQDEGPMLRAYLKQPEDLRMLEPAVRQLARLQITLAGTPAETLISLGAFDRRLDRLPQMFETMLEETDLLRVGMEDGLTEAQYSRLRQLAPVYGEMCLALKGYRVPESLHHDDFHDGNIFVRSEGGVLHFVFSDWEECAAAHPFFSMMLCLRSVSSRAGFPDEATETPEHLPDELSRLRDAYLDLWQIYESADKLVEIFNLAWRVGMVSRALTWRAFVRSLSPEKRADFNYIVPAWLQEFLLAMK